jgi:ferrochelatase
MNIEAVIVVNFGGPRSLNEVEPFLKALLGDQEVIRTPFPPFLHKWIFSRVAKKRAQIVIPDYQLIGGKSPIFEDTEAVGNFLRKRLSCRVLTFHRYLVDTHETFFKEVEDCSSEKILVFPLFPQFSYTTTGSIAQYFSKHLSKNALYKLSWVRSYPDHPSFIVPFCQLIKESLTKKKWREEKTILFFSPHGLPKKFVAQGDVYQKECEHSFRLISEQFPRVLSVLAYQSQFGKDEWIRPYTREKCQTIDEWGKGYEHVLFIPLSFTSDHIETLFEVEHQYLPVVKAKGYDVFRCPALNLKQEWLEGIVQILLGAPVCANQMLLRSYVK